MNWDVTICVVCNKTIPPLHQGKQLRGRVPNDIKHVQHAPLYHDCFAPKIVSGPGKYESVLAYPKLISYEEMCYEVARIIATRTKPDDFGIVVQTTYYNCTKCGFPYPYGGPRFVKAVRCGNQSHECI